MFSKSYFSLFWVISSSLDFFFQGKKKVVFRRFEFSKIHKVGKRTNHYSKNLRMQSTEHFFGAGLQCSSLRKTFFVIIWCIIKEDSYSSCVIIIISWITMFAPEFECLITRRRIERYYYKQRFVSVVLFLVVANSRQRASLFWASSQKANNVQGNKLLLPGGTE